MAVLLRLEKRISRPEVVDNAATLVLIGSIIMFADIRILRSDAVTPLGLFRKPRISIYRLGISLQHLESQQSESCGIHKAHLHP